MKLALPGEPHLTYCTNIHAGESFREVRANIEDKVAKVRARVAPGVPFGVGLRLSARAAQELSNPDELASFKQLLRDENMYVFTINGFPYGAFHAGAVVKESVYLPDWLDDARVLYTERLAILLAALLPSGVNVGSVSTVPGAFKARVASHASVQAMARRITAIGTMLRRLKNDTGKTIVLAIEPEPACYLETTEETVRFFEDELFRRADEDVVREHITVCFDACHMAVGFEDPRDALGRLAAAGISIGKIQISAGLEVDWAGGVDVAENLRHFAEDVYLHQVVAQRGDTLARFVDLPQALDARNESDSLWRVHFHVPIFRDQVGHFKNTQPYLRDLLAIVRARQVSPHLEIETYTWDVLPPELRRDGIIADVSREMTWVTEQLGL